MDAKLMCNIPERVLIGGIQKFSLEDGPGIRTTIFLKGCPLNCKWCHNPELIETQQELIMSPNKCIGCGYCISVCPCQALTMGPENTTLVDREKCDVCLLCTEECYTDALRAVGKSMPLEEIIRIAEEDKDFYDNTGGGITLSGGEILAHIDFSNALIDEAAKKNINVSLDTSGFGDLQALKEMTLKKNVTDILYDFKSIDDEIHIKYTGVSNKLIIDNLKMLASNPKILDKLTMRMPLIKGINDTDEIIKLTANLYREIGVKRVNLLPYHKLGVSKERNIGGKQDEFEEPTDERLTAIENYFRDEIGLEVEVLGRV